MSYECLEENQQLVVTTMSGVRSIENGPGCVCVPCCASTDKRGAIILETGGYAVVLNDQDGTKRSLFGPAVEWMTERETCVLNAKCPKLTQQEYLIVTDGEGHVRNVIGPALFKPGPYEEMTESKPVYNLSKNEYIRIKDQDGKLRVERGEQRVVPEPLEEV
eukprot:gene5506-8381_t